MRDQACLALLSGVLLPVALARLPLPPKGPRQPAGAPCLLNQESALRRQVQELRYSASGNSGAISTGMAESLSSTRCMGGRITPMPSILFAAP